MALYRGGLEPSAIYRGAVPVKKVMRHGGPSPVVVGSGPLNRITVPRSGWHSFHTWTAPRDMDISASFLDFAWVAPSSWEYTGIFHNGVLVGDQERAAVSFDRGFVVQAGDTVDFSGKCSAKDIDYRTVSSGDWQVMDLDPPPVEVWTAVITVTPQAPTFFTESPWYTLPTQEGVTYTVAGTPGYSQTVTVTATAQAGYKLAGQTSWTHTYGPPPVITVTPQAPTFLTESPWYTLPTQEGVTYSVTGTPGYGQSVTVTATPQVGYALEGQTSWTHTYPSPYPLSENWQGYVGRNPDVVHASHVFVEAGSFTVTVSATSQDANAWRVQLFDSGGVIALGGYRSAGGTSTASVTRTFAVNDVVEVRSNHSDPYNVGGAPGTATGTWSIVKN